MILDKVIFIRAHKKTINKKTATSPKVTATKKLTSKQK
jgi:hypothetical protein